MEAAILRQGGFGTLPPARQSPTSPTCCSRAASRPANKPIDFKEGTPDSQADRALEKLGGLARRFADESEAYRSLVHPMWTTHYGDYDHLARVKEWSSTGGLDDDGGGE